MNCEIDGKLLNTIPCNFYILSSFIYLYKCLCIFLGDMENQVEQEEKTRLINQVLELQHTLEGINPINMFVRHYQSSSHLIIFKIAGLHLF